MLPRPATIRCSVSSVFSCWRRARTSRAKSTHGSESSSGSQPSSSRPGASSASRAGSTTKASPNVRGSTKRSCPPWVKSITTWVCFALGVFGVAFSSWPLMRRWKTSHSPESSTITRYLPRRFTVLKVRPTTRVVSSSCVLRRTLRAPVISTALTFFPANSRSRSRRIVSTSGSSGMGGRVLLLESRARFPGGSLLRLLLRAALAVTPARRADEDRGEEPLLVVRTLLPDGVHRRHVEQPGGELLEGGLVVEHGQALHHVVEAVPEQAGDDGAGGERAAVDVDGADHGFERVGQDRRLAAPPGGGLALAEEDGVAQLHHVGQLGEGGGVHHGLADVGELALGQIGVALVGEVGHHPAEDGVAEEFQTLVRGVAGELGAPRAVGECLSEQRRVLELVAEPARQRPEVRTVGQEPFTLAYT